MHRLLTAAVALPLALAAIFGLPTVGFALLLLVIGELQAAELARLGRSWAPASPLSALHVLVPLAALLLSPVGLPWHLPLSGDVRLLTLALLLSVGAGVIVLVGRAPVRETASALGILGFGTVYLALPMVSLVYIRLVDVWLLILLVALVWVGDTAAFYCGTLWGRHKLAPVVSPNKTWEGALGSLAGALLVTALWSYWRLGAVDVTVVGIGALTSGSAQVGDLMESLIKRGAGVKDSGTLLPGHGGLLDRLDALLFAAPVFLLALHLAGRLSLPL